MKQRKMLSFTLYQLGLFFRQELPGLVAQADASRDAGEFRARLEEFVARHAAAQGEAAEQIRLLIGYDGREVSELSTGEQMPVRTLELLWQFLTGRLENPEMRCDLFIDLFFQFKRLEGLELQPLTPQRVRIRSDRWPTGLDPEVAEVRAQNRERMLHLLVQKIENRKSTPSRFRFEEGMTYEDKYRQVGVWWGDFRFHLAMAVKSPSELNRFLGNSLSAETMYLLSKARKKGMPFFATPYYLSLLDITGKAYDDEAIRSYILYSPQLVETYGNIRAWEKEDVVEAGKPNAAGWLLPDGNNIHRRYPRNPAPRRAQYPPPLSRSGDPDPRYDGACLRRVVRLVPADVRLSERTAQFRVREPAPQGELGSQTAPPDGLFRGGHAAARHPHHGRRRPDEPEQNPA